MLLISFSEMRDDSLEIEKGSTGVAWPSSARVVDKTSLRPSEAIWSEKSGSYRWNF